MKGQSLKPHLIGNSLKSLQIFCHFISIEIPPLPIFNFSLLFFFSPSFQDKTASQSRRIVELEDALVRLQERVNQVTFGGV